MKYNLRFELHDYYTKFKALVFMNARNYDKIPFSNIKQIDYLNLLKYK